jgi:hypothetical protein
MDYVTTQTKPTFTDQVRGMLSTKVKEPVVQATDSTRWMSHVTVMDDTGSCICVIDSTNDFAE